MADINLNSLFIPPTYKASEDTFLGTKVGELIVEKFVGRDKNYAQYYRCKCIHGGKYCKGFTYATKSHLTTYLQGKKGGTGSCGCVQKEMHDNGDFHKKHNLRDTRIYRIYCGIKARCFNPNRPAYKDYGGRGITICDEWLDKENGVQNFYNWSMANGYTDEKIINRINENGNYEPSNCEWIYKSEDKSDKRNSHYVDYYGLNLSLAQLKEYAPGVSYDTLKHRITNGMSSVEATTLPLFKNQNDRETYIKENYVNGKMISKPFKFLDEFKFTSENKRRIQTEIKPYTKEELEEITRNAPIAKDYWNLEDKGEEENKDK